MVREKWLLVRKPFRVTVAMAACAIGIVLLFRHMQNKSVNGIPDPATPVEEIDGTHRN